MYHYYVCVCFFFLKQDGGTGLLEESVDFGPPDLAGGIVISIGKRDGFDLVNSGADEAEEKTLAEDEQTSIQNLKAMKVCKNVFILLYFYYLLSRFISSQFCLVFFKCYFSFPFLASELCFLPF